MKKIFLFAVLFCSFFINVFSEEKKNDEEVAIILARSHNIPQDSVEETTDPYFEGYIQALVDMNYYEYRVIVLVKDRNVWITNLPKNKMLSSSIISYVRDVPGVKEVKVMEDGLYPKELGDREEFVGRPQVKGIWFPQTTELYLPMIANPRQVIYSLGYRGGDRVIGQNVAAFSMGDNFPIFRWLQVFGRGDLQIGIETGIWCVFNLDPHPNYQGGTEIVNTDYYVGIPLVYAVNQWAFRFRLYHISSHLGDEFLVNHPEYVNVQHNDTNHIRKNPSMEVVDLFASYQLYQNLRLYGGIGYIFHSDPTFRLKPLYFEYGGEANFGGCKFYYHKLYGNFFVATYFRNWQDVGFAWDQTYMVGYEWSKIQGVGRKIRFAFDYHNGFSVEGQFMKMRTSYYEVRFIYGF